MLLGPTELLILIVALGLILLVAGIVRRNGRLSGKLKLKDYVEAELNTERQPPDATVTQSAGANLAAKTIENSTVINADQVPGGQAGLNADTISGSTVVNVTGPANMGNIFGAGHAPSNNPTPAEPGLKHKAAKALTDLFEIEELETLCFDLGLDADEISGETKSAKTRALVNYCDNRARLDELIDAIKAHRPNADL